MHARRTTLRCLFVAWVLGWAVAVYLPSALIVLAGLSPLAEGRAPFGAIFAVADEVAPAAKIGFGLLFGAFLLLARRLSAWQGPRAAAGDMVLAAIAMLLVLAILPADWSRGFGVGLTGTRFAIAPTLIYLAGAAAAGLVFTLAEARCLARSGAIGDGGNRLTGQPQGSGLTEDERQAISAAAERGARRGFLRGINRGGD